MLTSSSYTYRDRPVDLNLDDLVHRSRNGDLESFDTLVGRYYRMTFGIAFRMLGDREAAEDATQEIFIKAWRSLNRFRSAARFTTWLHSIAVHHCLDTARKRTREAARVDRLAPPEEEDLDPRGMARASSPRASEWDLCLMVREAIERLPEKLQVVVILHYLAEQSVEEISRALNLHPNTVYTRLNQSMQRLKRSLGDLEIR